MYSRICLLLSGALGIASAWLPWITILGESQNGFRGDYAGNPGLFFIVMGAIVLIMGAINKKWSVIVGIIFALLICGLGLKYYNDSTSKEAVEVGAKVGFGIYAMIIGGLLGVAGGVMRFFVKKPAVVTA